MLVVEPPRPGDAQQVQELAGQALQTELTDGFCLVARWVETDKVVGFVLANVGESLDAHVLAIAVDEEHRGQGIGSTLLRSLTDHLASRGARSLELLVRADNQMAQEFYRLHGYEPVGLLERQYQDGEAAVRWRRAI